MPSAATPQDPKPLPPQAWAQALALLPDALALPADQRANWLNRQTQDAQVHACIGKLLAQRAAMEAEDFLAAPAQPWSADEALAGIPGLVPEAMVGRYRLIQPIGQGGMSVVWLAEQQEDDFVRPVALKFPHAAAARPEFAQRLVRERRILAALAHPHIARLYDVGITAGGFPFMALEHVPGLPIDAHCRDKQHTVHQRLHMFLQVLEAVQYAHANLVLHRDIKPSNVLVDHTGQARLLDFGIAKLLDDTGSTDDGTLLTQAAGTPLTPIYASPEQARGEPLGAASDVFSLGVLLYELLCGERPFSAADRAKHLADGRLPPPQLPSQRLHRQAATGQADCPRLAEAAVRGDLDAIVLRALEPELERRYESARSLHDDILRHLHAEPVLARPRRRAYVVGRFMQRHRAGVAAVSVSAAAMAGGTALAVHQALRATDEAARAQAVSAFMVEVFEANTIDQLDAAAARRQPAEVLLANSARKLIAGGLTHPQARDEVQRVLGHLLHDLTVTDLALGVRQQRVQQLQAQSAPRQTQATAWFDLANTLHKRGELPAAHQALDSAQRLLLDLPHTHDDTARLRAQVALAQGRLALVDGRPAPAREHLRRAQDASAAFADVASALQGPLLELEAGLLSVEGQHDAATKALIASAEAHRTGLGAKPARLGAALYRLGQSFWELGRLPEAIKLMQEAHALVANSAGPGHSSALLIRQQVGRLSLYMGEVGRAQTTLQEAHAGIQALGEQLDPASQVRSIDYLVEALLANGRLRQAQQLIDANAPLLSKVETLPFEDRFYHELLRCDLDASLGRYAQATSRVDRVSAQVAAQLGQPSAAWMDIEMRRLDVLRAAGRYTDATRHLARLRQALIDKPEMQPQFATALQELELVLWLDTGQYAEAARRLNAPADGPRPPDNAAQGLAAAWRRGRLALGLGQSAAAQGFFEEAVKHLTQQGHEDNPNLAQARLMLADALAAQGHLSKAAALQADARRALRAQSAGPHYQVTRPPRQPSMPDEPVLRISHHPITPPRTP